MRSIEYTQKKSCLSRRRAICALALPFLFLLVRSAKAATAQTQSTGDVSNLKTLSLAQLGNVNVTSVSKEPVAMQRTPAAIYVLTQDDIRRSGATSIPELLRTVPGVEVARIDSDHWSIGIRGFGSEFSKSVLVLIDGRSVYSPLFSGVYWNVQNVMLEDVQRIEVIRGQGGTIWGANAVSGVINIITKNSAETRGLLVSSGAGNVDQGTGASGTEQATAMEQTFEFMEWPSGATRKFIQITDRLIPARSAKADSVSIATKMGGTGSRCKATRTRAT